MTRKNDEYMNTKIAPTKVKTALVLPGGGARGAYQVGVVKAIAEIIGREQNPFPIICGASAGAINAAVLASRANEFAYGISQLEKFWGEIRCKDVYRTDGLTILATLSRLMGAVLFGVFGASPPKSLLDNRPLEQLLRRSTRLDGIESAINSGQLDGVSITASAYTTANAVSFFQGKVDRVEWQRTRRRGLRQDIKIEHLLASAALPFLFPAQKIRNQYYGDGGLRMVAPLSPAIHLGAERILIIGTRDRRTVSEPAAPVAYPSMAELGGYLLDTIFMDNLDADISRLKRINHTLSLLDDEQLQRTSLRTIKTLEILPSVDVRDITKEHAGSIPPSVRYLLKAIGGWGSDWRMPSYLLFEAAYTKTLMDLGYQDAFSQNSQIKEFFEVD